MTTEQLKESIGRILYVCSIVLLVAYGVVTLVSFAIAAHDGRIPAKWWVRDSENHGPWRHYEPIHTLYKCALASLIVGALMSKAALSFMKGNRPVVLLVSFIVLLVIDVVFLHWLTQ